MNHMSLNLPLTLKMWALFRMLRCMPTHREWWNFSKEVLDRIMIICFDRSG